MFRLLAVFVALTILTGVVTGCRQQGTPQTKVIEVPMPKGLDRAKMLLQNYAQGQPLGSEAEDFPQIVEEVRKTDPEKANILQEGFAQIQKNPAQARRVAQELLKKL